MVTNEDIFRVREEYKGETGRTAFEKETILSYVNWLERRVAEDFIPASKPTPTIKSKKDKPNKGKKLFMVVQTKKERSPINTVEHCFNVISKGHTTGYSALMEIASRQNPENYVIMKYWEVSR